jgi:hypothetical protein
VAEQQAAESLVALPAVARRCPHSARSTVTNAHQSSLGRGLKSLALQQQPPTTTDIHL